MNAAFDRKPVVSEQEGCDGWESADDSGVWKFSVLNKLQFMNGLVGETKEEGVAVDVTQVWTTMVLGVREGRREGGMEAVNIAKMEVG